MTSQLKTGGSTVSTRKIAAAATFAGFLLFGSMAAAWACTALATLEVTPAAGTSGQQVEGKGSGFKGGTFVGATPQQVEVRWQSKDGPVVARVIPTPSGNIKFDFTLPEGAPGYYTVIASQKDPSGKEIGGGPARATVALNNPPKPAEAGAGEASAVDQQTAGADAPSGVVRHAAPSAKAPAAAEAQPVLRQDPAPVIRPTGSRSSDILASNARSASSPVANLAMMMAIVGGGALLIAVGAAMVATRRTRSQG